MQTLFSASQPFLYSVCTGGLTCKGFVLPRQWRGESGCQWVHHQEWVCVVCLYSSRRTCVYDVTNCRPLLAGVNIVLVIPAAL